jgi:hypothetical protein
MHAAAPASSITAAPATPSTGKAPAALLPAIYNGLNKPGIAASADPVQEVPPDSTGAIGPDDYVEIVNSVIEVWNRNLTTVSTLPLYQFIGVPGVPSNYPLCDVQVQWDPAADRWLFSFLFCNTSSSSQGFYFGWSRTSNPEDLVNGWCVLGLQTTPYLLDYDKLGHNSKYLIVGGNFYDMTTPSTNPPFQSASILFAPLPATGDTGCVPTGVFSVGSPGLPLKNGDGVTNAFTPIPVNTMSSSGDGYVIADYDAGGNVTSTPAPQSTLAVWHINSSGAVFQDSDIPVPLYAIPPSAPQTGSTNLIDTLDSRLTQAVGDPVSGIWTQHTVAGGLRSQVTWYELQQSGGSLALTQSGNITSATDFIFNAAISPSFSARGAAIFYNKSSSTTLPSIAGQVRINSTPSGGMEPGEVVLATSGGADVETISCAKPIASVPCRWGDYSGASPDPANPYLVWGTNEMITAATATPAWQDENFAVVAAAPPAPPTDLNATSGHDGYSCVSFAPPTADFGAPVTSFTITAYQGATIARSVTIPAPASLGCVNGLTDGLTYTFTVSAANLAGSGPESAHSPPATPLRGAVQTTSGAPPPPATRPGVNPAPTAPPPPPR